MDFDALDSLEEQLDDWKEEDAQGIAIIGMHAQIGECKNAEEFWQALVHGRDLICDFPSKRWEDAEEICKNKYDRNLSEELTQEAYLDRIDLFDAEYFNISPMEAKLMSPLQRLFLESAWTAVEDAGYGGDKLKGTRTGVYVGHTKSGTQYEELAAEEGDGFAGILVSGNVTSVIASRISYLLDLKGPAMITDTACSSSLVSLHLAVRQLEDREIDMAIVGGITVTLIPAEKQREHIGIESSSERTKTFDNSADGTGGGEGVISVVLKPLAQALEDGDHIYAAIKGSSINQDGASVGITAPNVAAQEDVIVNAWKEAKIDPETISYIEAHGTATNLGDPVEVEGLKRAFGRYTKKKQFCYLGAVKTNTGHLDATAGMVGLVKTILMMKYKQIPPNLYFQVPNKKIDFLSSPITVNDTLREWNCEGTKRRCGISSFGISGTNCHVVLEEVEEPFRLKIADYMEYKVLAMSALTKKQVIQIAHQYQGYLRDNEEADFEDFCYTANTGRGHYTCRLAVLVKNREEFLNLNLEEESLGEAKDNVFYSEHRITEKKTDDKEGKITVKEQQSLSGEADALVRELAQCGEQEFDKVKRLIELYVKGAGVPWEAMYHRGEYHRLSIPVYPFLRKRYWVKMAKKKRKTETAILKKELHPFVEECETDTYGVRVYKTVMSPEKHWILKEHKIQKHYVLPGTAYVEMGHFAGREILKTTQFEMKDIVFMTPMICVDGENRIVNLIAKTDEKDMEISIVSRKETEKEWICHVEMHIQKMNRKVTEKWSQKELEEIKSRCEQMDTSHINDQDSMVQLSGIRWNNTKKIWFNEKEILEYMELDAQLEEEQKAFYLYPTLLDGAVNVGNILAKGFSLPFSYQKAVFYQKIPSKFYSFLRKKAEKGEEIVTYDVVLCDLEGNVIGQIEDYTLKRVNHLEHFITKGKLEHGMYHQLIWTVQTEKYPMIQNRQGKIIAICKPDDDKEAFIQCLERQSGKEVTRIVVEQEQKDYEQKIRECAKEKISDIVYLIGWEAAEKQEKSMTEVSKIQGLFYLTKAILEANIKNDIQITVLTEDAIEVTGKEATVNPIAHALAQMATCIAQEYDNIKVKVIDRDKKTSDILVVQKIFEAGEKMITAFRENESYIQKMIKLEDFTGKKVMELREKGNYVIAGGFGGMGITFAKTLWNLNPSINLILLGRSFGAEETLSELKKRSNAKQAEFFQWAEGKNVFWMKVDITNEKEMECAFQEIHQRFGNVDGILQTAGVEGNGFLYHKDWQTFFDVLNPKVKGTWNLYQQTKQDKLEWFLMCSSFASIFGTAGQSDYVAANAYLDSFSYYLRKKGVNAISINWTGWSESGMAFRNQVDSSIGLFQFVTDEEGGILLEHILKLYKTRVLVGEMNQDIVNQEIGALERRVDMSEVKEEQENVLPKEQERAIGNITVIGKSMDKLTDTEKQIIEVWTQTLGVSEVDINRKFFEAGGNSLLTAALHRGINKIYPGVMSITDIFVYSSVTEIADYIDSKRKKEQQKTFETIEEDEDIDDLLAKFVNGDISKDMIEKLI